MQSPDHPSGISTPPLQTLAASVPFKWEVQPGKPRPCTDIIALPAKPLELELPPCRMTSSPTAVLDGPYNVGRPKFYSFRLFFKGSFDSSSSSSSDGSDDVDVSLGKKRKWVLKLKKNNGGGGGSFGFSHASGSFSGARPSTHLSWAAIYQSLKQVVPWKSTPKSKKDGLL